MNIYKNREKHLSRYFTEKGVAALENRLTNLTRMYVEEQEYPFKSRMVGFPTLIVKSKEHLEGMIENLKEILGLRIIEVHYNDN